MKNNNPYQKKHAKKLRITRKQWTRIICLGIVLALIVGLVIITRSGLSEKGGNHDGHNHEDETVVTDEHGHAADTHNTTAHNSSSGAGKLRYQLYTDSKTNTHGIGIYNSKNQLLLEKKGMPNAPIREKEGDLTLVYFAMSLNGFTNGVSIYCDEQGERVSDAFHGVIGTDGVRVAYCSDDDTTIIVQDLFDKSLYYKEYKLTGVYQNGTQTIKGGRVTNGVAVVTYACDSEGNTATKQIKLYE